MLQIKYQNEFLDIAPGQDITLEKNSAISILDNLLAEYSVPINFTYSDKNARLFGFIFFDKTIRKKQKLEVEIWCDGTFRYNATLVIESAGLQTNIASKSSCSGYLLTGVSNFFTAIKDKKLSDLTLGGQRVMSFTTFNPVDNSGGYWQKFQDTWNFNDDYVVCPVINEAINSDNEEYQSPNWYNGLAQNKASGWMNMMEGAKLYTQQPVFPFPKVSYVLSQIFAEAGWKLDTSGINDAQWDRLLMFTAYYVPTTKFDVHWNPFATPRVLLTPVANAQITLELKKAMPKDITCSQFVFALCMRYGWFPDCNSGTKTCRLIALKELGNKPPKDFTPYTASSIQTQFSNDQRLFAFKNNFVGDDQYPGSLDMKQFTSGNAVYSQRNLPVLGDGSFDNTLIYSFLENRYWKVIFDEEVGERVWTVHADNIYNEEAANATDTFETNAAPMPISYNKYDGNYSGLFPYCDNNVYGTWGIRTMIYHGKVKQVDTNGNAGPNEYPYASSLYISPAADSVLAWSDVYRHKDLANIDHGIIEYWWKNWMKMNSSVENAVKINLNLPLHELIQLEWDDIIIIHNVPYMFKSFIEPLNYKGSIQATLQRIALS